MSVISAAASRPVLPSHLARLAQQVQTLTKTCINHCMVSQHKSSHNKRLANTHPDLQSSGCSQSTRTIHFACSECCFADGCRNSPACGCTTAASHQHGTRQDGGRENAAVPAALLLDLALHSSQGASATSVSNQSREAAQQRYVQAQVQYRARLGALKAPQVSVSTREGGGDPPWSPPHLQGHLCGQTC